MGWMLALVAAGYIVLVEKPKWVWKVWNWVKTSFNGVADKRGE